MGLEVPAPIGAPGEPAGPYSPADPPAVLTGVHNRPKSVGSTVSMHLTIKGSCVLTRSPPSTTTSSTDLVVLANDAVLIFAGGVLPTQFLADAGITLQRHFGRRIETLQ